MWSVLGRRALDFAVGFFALLGFVFVPLGERTAFDHAKAIFTTGAAVEAGRELVEAGDRLRRRALGGRSDPGPELPRPENSATPAPSGPRPEPPPMAQTEALDAGADASLPWPDPG